MRNTTDPIKVKFRSDNTLTIIIVAAILVGILMVIIKLGFVSVYATKGDNIADITSQKASIVEENKKIESEIAELQSVSHIEKIAKDKLGMVKAKPVVYLDTK